MDASLNLVEPARAAPRRGIGDVPAELGRLYLTDARGGPGLAFYVDARTSVAAFRDQGGRLTTSRNDPSVVRDLVKIARHRDWTTIDVRGETGFRREVWLAARAAGLEVRGYRPTERDTQDLARRRARRTDRPLADGRAQPAEPESPTAEDPRLRIVEAVVQGRVHDEATRTRLMAAARRRLADALDRGVLAESPGRRRPRERQRDA